MGALLVFSLIFLIFFVHLLIFLVDHFGNMETVAPKEMGKRLFSQVKRFVLCRPAVNLLLLDTISTSSSIACFTFFFLKYSYE